MKQYSQADQDYVYNTYKNRDHKKYSDLVRDYPKKLLHSQLLKVINEINGDELIYVNILRLESGQLSAMMNVSMLWKIHRQLYGKNDTFDQLIKLIPRTQKQIKYEAKVCLEIGLSYFFKRIIPLIDNVDLLAFMSIRKRSFLIEVMKHPSFRLGAMMDEQNMLEHLVYKDEDLDEDNSDHEEEINYNRNSSTIDILLRYPFTDGLFYYLTYHFLPKLTFLIHIQYHSNKLYLKYNLYYRQKLFSFKCSN